MLTLAQLITLLAAVALLGKAGWDYYHSVKDGGRNLIIGILVLGLALFLVVNEIATGSPDGMIGAIANLITAILKNVAASFENSTIGTLSTAVPKIVPTIMATAKP
mgnify:CR=1 FL=1